MDSQRLVLFFVFTMSVFLLYESWQRDHQQSAAATAVSASVTPTPTPETKSAQPAAGVPPAPSAALLQNPSAPPAVAAASGGQIIKVETDLYRAEISTSGGDLVFVAGNHDSPAQAKDGQGSAAAFVGIKRIRNLPDNRLLVLDANAVRLVDETGTVRTLFTLASSGIAGDAIVDMAPRGRDVYLTLVNQPMLMLAKDVLP